MINKIDIPIEIVDCNISFENNDIYTGYYTLYSNL